MSNLTGQSLGRYHILEQLGEGGMATVYKAFDTRLEREVAVKVIRREAFPPNQLERILARFEREAKSLARLNHSNIVTVIDYGEQDGKPYLVMPYIAGGTLKDQLGKPMPWQDAAKILLSVARGLAYAHQRGIVHRDVKPSNILITESGDPLLTDFGIAKLLEGEDGQTLTGTGVGIGTPEYMAPEQGLGKEIDGRADLYALGIVFYELLTGRKPYTADTPMAAVLKHVTDPQPHPSQFAPGLPDAVEKLILKALAKQPEDRHASMGDFVRALETLLEAQPGPAPEKAKPAFLRPHLLDPQVTRDNLPITPASLKPIRDEPLAPAYRPQSAPSSRRIPTWVWGVGGMALLAFCALAVMGLYNLSAASLVTPTASLTPMPTRTTTPNPTRMTVLTPSVAVTQVATVTASSFFGVISIDTPPSDISGRLFLYRDTGELYELDFSDREIRFIKNLGEDVTKIFMLDTQANLLGYKGNWFLTSGGLGTLNINTGQTGIISVTGNYTNPPSVISDVSRSNRVIILDQTLWVGQVADNNIYGLLPAFLKKDMSMQCPTWRPGKEQVAFIGNKYLESGLEGNKVLALIWVTDDSVPIYLYNAYSYYGLSCPVWSPDGQELLFSDSDLRELKIVNPGTGKFEKIDNVSTSAYAWSYDGTWIAYVFDGSLYVVNRATLEKYKIGSTDAKFKLIYWSDE